jgi:hypothetical protein
MFRLSEILSEMNSIFSSLFSLLCCATTTTTFPYYTGVLVCEQSMEQIGIRRATKKTMHTKENVLLPGAYGDNQQRLCDDATEILN